MHGLRGLIRGRSSDSHGILIGLTKDRVAPAHARCVLIEFFMIWQVSADSKCVEASNGGWGLVADGLRAAIGAVPRAASRSTGCGVRMNARSFCALLTWPAPHLGVQWAHASAHQRPLLVIIVFARRCDHHAAPLPIAQLVRCAGAPRPGRTAVPPRSNIDSVTCQRARRACGCAALGTCARIL